MKEELRHELVRLIYSPEIVSFELTREQGLEILEEIKRLNKENEQLRTELNSKESIINKAIEVIDLVKPELWNISNKITYRLLDIKNILVGDDKK